MSPRLVCEFVGFVSCFFWAVGDWKRKGGERAPTACGRAPRAAMATRRASPTEPRRPAGPRGPVASPPVLSLSHFCTKPFLCFGDVRLGASRTLPLALANPNAEEASVSLPRLPAAARGFGVRPRAFVLQVGAGGGPRRPAPRAAARGGRQRTGHRRRRSQVPRLTGGQQGPRLRERGRGRHPGGDRACAEHPRTRFAGAAGAAGAARTRADPGGAEVEDAFSAHLPRAFKGPGSASVRGLFKISHFRVQFEGPESLSRQRHYEFW